MASRARRWFIAFAVSVVLVALVTALIKLAHPHGPARGLAVLYILAVVAAAVRYGPAFAFVSALLSVLAFDLFFLSPNELLHLSNATDVETYVAFLATALVVGLLSSRLRRQAEDATRLTAEQESLRRVASLVARGASPTAVLEGIREELNNLDGAQMALLFQGDRENDLSLVASAGVSAGPATTRRAESSRPTAMTSIVWFDSNTPTAEYATMFGAYAVAVAGLGADSGLAQPVAVAGRPWGFVVVAAHNGTLTASAGRRVADYIELLGTAIDNGETRAELQASRVRIITAADETRRRIERDLHDGAQQRLVSLALRVGAAHAIVPSGQDQLRSELADVTDGLRGLLEDVREMARGLHPAILAQGGLGPALKTLARRSSVPVELDLRLDQRLPSQTELTAYYIVSELLANVAKHAGASTVRLEARARVDALELTVADDGIGGADVTSGSGLVGVVDRVSANDGTVNVHSPVGGGTAVKVVLPVSRWEAKFARPSGPET
jgi:signal transduction histidine kinase